MTSFVEDITNWFKGKLSISVYLVQINTSEWIFRLHYVWTAWLLLLFTCMLCWKEWMGGHIKCLPIEEDTSNVPVIPQKVINTYCYVSSTFTVPFDPRIDAFASKGPRSVKHSQLGGPQYVPGSKDQIFHSYYQWVAYFLFLQAMVFQATQHIWTYYENKKIAQIVTPLNTRDLKVDDESGSLKRLAKYLLNSKGEHFWWSSIYILCEFGNLIVIVFNIYFTDYLMGGEFSRFGIQVVDFLNQDPEERLDPMARVFPRVTKCLFHMYGPSGTIQRFDTLCILTSNIVNEKIFTFLWFWFLFVAVMTAAQFIYRIATLVSLRVRLMGLQVETYPMNSQVAVVLERITTTDWILLRLLRLNLDTRRFQKLIMKMYDEILEI